MNKHIENTIIAVNDSFPSLFTKDDVIKLLQDLDKKLTPEDVVDEDFLERFREKLHMVDFTDFVEIDETELELECGHRGKYEITVSHVPVDERGLIDKVIDAYTAALE